MLSKNSLFVILMLLSLRGIAQTPPHYFHQPANVGVNNLFLNDGVSKKFLFIYTQAELASMVSPVTGSISFDTLFLRSNMSSTMNLTGLVITIGHSTLNVPVNNFAANFNVGVSQVVLNAPNISITTLPGAWNVPSDKWTAFPIGNFTYDGINNLVVQMEYQTNSFPAPFYAENGGVPVSVYAGTNGAANATGNTARPMFGFTASCNLTLGADTIICPGQSVTIAGTPNLGSYFWNTGDTTSTIIVSAPGTYILTVNGSCGFLIDTVIVTQGVCGVPLISISSSDTIFCDKQCIDFTDLSINTPTSWLWTFSGGSPSTSTDQNPIGICYNNYGAFDVQLIACNAAGCDTLLLPAFITELQVPAPPSVFVQGDSLVCTTVAASYAWFNINNANLILGTNNYFVPSTAGVYYVLITDSNQCQNVSANISSTVGIYEVLLSTINSYWNNDNFVIESKLPLVGYAVTDMSGKIILQEKITGTQKIIISKNSFTSTGVYFIRVEGLDGSTQVLKIVNKP